MFWSALSLKLKILWYDTYLWLQLVIFSWKEKNFKLITYKLIDFPPKYFSEFFHKREGVLLWSVHCWKINMFVAPIKEASLWVPNFPNLSAGERVDFFPCIPPPPLPTNPSPTHSVGMSAENILAFTQCSSDSVWLLIFSHSQRSIRLFRSFINWYILVGREWGSFFI